MQHETKKSRPIDEDIRFIRRSLFSSSPIHDENVTIALFDSYLWNITAYSVALYWTKLVEILGIVHWLKNFMPNFIAFLIYVAIIPVVFMVALDIGLTSVPQRRLASLIAGFAYNVFRNVLLYDYRLTLYMPPTFLVPVVYATTVSLAVKWLGNKRMDVWYMTSSTLLIVYTVYGAFMNHWVMASFTWWAMILCLVAFVQFQLKIESIRMDEEGCSLEEGSRCDLLGIAVVMLTYFYGEIDKH